MLWLLSTPGDEELWDLVSACSIDFYRIFWNWKKSLKVKNMLCIYFYYFLACTQSGLYSSGWNWWYCPSSVRVETTTCRRVLTKNGWNIRVYSLHCKSSQGNVLMILNYFSLKKQNWLHYLMVLFFVAFLLYTFVKFYWCAWMHNISNMHYNFEFYNNFSNFQWNFYHSLHLNF